MTKTILILLTVYVFSFTSFGQDKQIFIPSLDKKVLMPFIFKNSTFNERDETKWKPAMPHTMEDIVSDDGHCYTHYDTLIYFKGKDHIRGNFTNRASVVFSTSQYRQGTKMDCHVCAPVLGLATFTKTDNSNWRLDQFHPLLNAHGGFGERGKLSVERFSKDLFCLKVLDHYMNHGYYSEYTTYYSLSGRHNIILEFESYATNDGTDDNAIYHRTTKLQKQTGTPLFLELVTVNEEGGAKMIKKYQYTNIAEAFELSDSKKNK